MIYTLVFTACLAFHWFFPSNAWYLETFNDFSPADQTPATRPSPPWSPKFGFLHGPQLVAVLTLLGFHTSNLVGGFNPSEQ